jgi:hypothetical protein
LRISIEIGFSVVNVKKEPVGEQHAETGARKATGAVFAGNTFITGDAWIIFLPDPCR